MTRVLIATIALVGALFAAPCGGGGGERTGSPSGTVAGTVTPRPTVTASPGPTVTASPPPISEPVEIAGVTLYPQQAWYEEGRSQCASLNPGAPYFGPSIFSVRDEELPQLDLSGRDPTDVRMCKHGGVSSISYVLDDGIVHLVVGPAEWAVAVPLESISSGGINGRPAVFVAPEQVHGGAAVVLMATEFGLIVVALGTTLGEVKAIAAAIDSNPISIPLGKPSFEGTINGIRLYNTLAGGDRAEGCGYSPYVVDDREFVGIEVPEDSPLAVSPSFLPDGYSMDLLVAYDCGGGLDLVEASFSGGALGLHVTRATGEAAWALVGSEDWVTAGTVAGLPAVFVVAPEWVEEEQRPVVLVKEAFGITVVAGPVSLDDAVRVAEGLNR